MISARERKQKIEVDPRNTTWSEDAGGFGFRMLERMGWSKGKGLGKHEDGTVQHLKQKMKQDLSGIGANDKDTSQNWLAHTDAYASLLSNLKTIGPSTETASSSSSESESSDEEERPTGGLGASSEKAKREKEADEIMTNNPRYGRLYHRAKFQKGKNARDYDTASLNAILGIPNTVPASQAGGKKVAETTVVLDNGWVKSKTVINERTEESETTEVVEKLTLPEEAPRKRKSGDKGDVKKEKKKKKKPAPDGVSAEGLPREESVSSKASKKTKKEKRAAREESVKSEKKKKKSKSSTDEKLDKKKRKDGAEEKTEKKKRKKASSS